MKRNTLTLEQLNKEVERANKNGGSLDLSNLTSIPEGFNPTVGGALYLSNQTININKPIPNGTYVDGKYLYCDNMLIHVKRKKQIGEYTYYIGKIPGMNAISDGEIYAHCENFKDGLTDLAFKKAKDRGASQYNDLTLESEISFEEAKAMYRIITGACKAGTEQFIKGLAEVKEKYKVAEIIELTKGQYRASVFESFFEKSKGGAE